jgi:F0F1-type ATP synthase assembly protein I
MHSPGLVLQPLRFEREPATFPDDDRHRVDRQYLRFAGVGVQYALTILILTLAGIWLDDKLGTAPLFLIVLLLLAFVGATWSLVHTVLGPDKKGPKP